jgi:isocitrate/isopropylmalate dehydrogenase
VALILSAALMLRHLGEGDAARPDRARASIGVLEEGRVRTRDLGGTAGHARGARRDRRARSGRRP